MIYREAGCWRGPDSSDDESSRARMVHFDRAGPGSAALASVAPRPCRSTFRRSGREDSYRSGITTLWAVAWPLAAIVLTEYGAGQKGSTRPAPRPLLAETLLLALTWPIQCCQKDTFYIQPSGAPCSLPACPFECCRDDLRPTVGLERRKSRPHIRVMLPGSLKAWYLLRLTLQRPAPLPLARFT